MRKLLYIPLFFLLSLTISTYSLSFTLSPDQSELSTKIAEASDISRDRVSQITTDIVQDRFDGSLINLDQQDIDVAVAESDSAQKISELSDSAVAKWLVDQTDTIDTSAIRESAANLSSDTLSAIQDKVRELPDCQTATEFINLEAANCNPGESVLSAEVSRISQELLGGDTDQNLDPPLWMQAISKLYGLSNGSAGMFLLLATLVWAAVIVVSYGNPLKGIGGLGKGLMFQGFLIGLGAVASLMISSFLLRLLGLDSLVESLTLLSGVKIWQSWQSTTLVLAVGVFILGLLMQLLSRLRLKSRDNKTKPSHTGRVMHDEPDQPVLDQQIASLYETEVSTPKPAQRRAVPKRRPRPASRPAAPRKRTK